MNATEVIQLMKLEPLPGEGGFFKRTYCSKQNVIYGGESKPIVSAIYYLITPEDFSAFHKLKRDEIFHFYAGDSVEFVQISDGNLKNISFGNDIANGDHPQVVVEGGVWQALRIAIPKLGWALIGTTVSPAFEFEDFLIGERKELLIEFPNLKETIMKFTRESIC